MKTPRRLGGAIALLVVLVWIYIHIQAIWTPKQGSPAALLDHAGLNDQPAKPKAVSEAVRPGNAGSGHAADQPSNESPAQTTTTAASIKNTAADSKPDKVVVTGKLSSDNTDWIITDLPE